MDNFIRKITSRKFLLSLVGVITGIATALSNLGGDVGVVAGLVLTVVSIITYNIAESKIDIANKQISLDAQKITEEVIKAIETMKKGDE